jgi:hypothetical protein
MCQCGTKPAAPPAAAPNAGQPAGNAVAVCPGFQSSILVIDELGLPMQNTSVQIAIAGGAPQSFVTDAQGRVCFHHPPGTAVEVKLSDTHESQPGQSTTTPSGRHFGHLAPGP